MKQTVNYIVKAYGIDDVRYTVLTYGATPTEVVTFRNIFPTSLALRNAIGSARRSNERPNLHVVLNSARKIFEENARPDGRKVTVLSIYIVQAETTSEWKEKKISFKEKLQSLKNKQKTNDRTNKQRNEQTTKCTNERANKRTNKLNTNSMQ